LLKLVLFKLSITDNKQDIKFDLFKKELYDIVDHSKNGVSHLVNELKDSNSHSLFQIESYLSKFKDIEVDIGKLSIILVYMTEFLCM
jgi:hypothetical protein